jgi:hypothetical protein
MRLTLEDLAIQLTRKVLPQPGGPLRMIPLGRLQRLWE